MKTKVYLHLGPEGKNQAVEMARVPCYGETIQVDGSPFIVHSIVWWIPESVPEGAARIVCLTPEMWRRAHS